MSDDFLRKMQEITDQISNVTSSLLSAAQDKNWEQFIELAKKRELLLHQFEQWRQLVLKEVRRRKVSLPELDEWVKAQFQNVSKVNQRIGDIINEEKKQIMGDILRTLKGKAFLDRFRQRRMDARIISKTY